MVGFPAGDAGFAMLGDLPEQIDAPEQHIDLRLSQHEGFLFLLPPEAAIGPSEHAVSIDAAIAMRARFGHDAPAVRAFFDALAGLLTGRGQKQ